MKKLTPLGVRRKRTKLLAELDDRIAENRKYYARLKGAFAHRPLRVAFYDERLLTSEKFINEDARRIMTELQSRCPHSNVTEQADPSGGSDPAKTCSDCGKEW